jgi:hypothetical protein
VNIKRGAIVALTSVALVAGASGAAQANNSPTVDRAEYAAIHAGQSLAKVRDITDAKGTKLGGGARQWKVSTSRHGLVIVGFDQGRVEFKSSYWGSRANYKTGRITKREYRKIRVGQSLAKVRDITNAKGRVITHSTNGESGRPEQTLRFGTPTRVGSVFVNFEKRGGVWRLTGKISDAPDYAW